MKTYKCIDCGKTIKGYGKRCSNCRIKGEKHYNWKGGKPNCQICGKKIAHKSKLCKKCYITSNKEKFLNNFGNRKFNGTKHTKGSKEKMKEKREGQLNPSWKGGITFVKCIDCKKKIRRGKNKHKRCKGCYNKIINDNGNPNWKGGKSFEPYSIKFKRHLKNKIRVRDNFTCQLCNISELELNERLSIHHINYDKNDCSESNLIALCRKCNSRANGNRNYYKKYFQEKLCHLNYY